MTDPVATVSTETLRALAGRLRDRAGFRVALVCMPWSSAGKPSIQLGLLSATCEREGFPTDTYHFNVELAAALSVEVYEPLCNHRGRMTGEWLFSVAAFGEVAAGAEAAYFDAFPDEIQQITRDIQRDPEYLIELRRSVLPGYIEQCLATVDWGQYRVVGFSSTFQQNVACLALARRIKEQYPAVTIVFGGANMEDEMGPEHARAFPFLDYVVVGEGDAVFPALLHCLAAGEEPVALPGLVCRSDGEVISSGPATPIGDLDALPTPRYEEYFERAARLGVLGHPAYPRMVPFESSRGCWWGAKHHCTFCGLNGLNMAYRSKQPARVLAELSELTRRYSYTAFEAVDNIVDMSYVKNLFATVETSRTDYEFFYEVKANLTREQLRTMARGGVRSIQPGIESFSTHVLGLMRKGCTLLQNVRLLKWARYYGLYVSYNLLTGFPGETEADYRQQLHAITLLTHLQPPKHQGRIWLERFAPYFTDREHFPARDIRPDASYAHAYPVAGLDQAKIAYFFEYTMDDTLPDDAPVFGETEAAIATWNARWHAERPDTLSYRRTLDSLLIDDFRGPNPRGTRLLQGAPALIYEFCGETMRTPRQVVAHIQEQGGRLSEDGARATLAEFSRLGLMLGEEDRYLSLALPTNPHW